jgi:hypothetical protein
MKALRCVIVTVLVAILLNPSASQRIQFTYLLLATVPVLDPAGIIGLRGNGLTPSKIDDFLREPSLQSHKY